MYNLSKLALPFLTCKNTNLLVISLIFITAAVHAHGAENILTNIAYGSDPAQTLDICQPNLPAPRPAAILIHGGGWISGDKKDYEWLCQTAAASGIAAVAINYRLATGAPDHRWPAQIEDVRAAASWLQQHFADFKIGKNAICVVGSSSGAQLALYFGLEGKVFRPACIVDEFGPTDLTTWKAGGMDLFGSTSEDVLEAKRQQMSPLFLVDKAAPPILIIHGTHDAMVPISQSDELYQALTKVGSDVKRISYDGGHSFADISDQARLSIFESEIQFIIEMTSGGKK